MIALRAAPSFTPIPACMGTGIANLLRNVCQLRLRRFVLKCDPQPLGLSHWSYTLWTIPAQLESVCDCVVVHFVDNRSPTERRSCFSRSFLDTAINIVQLLCIEVSCVKSPSKATFGEVCYPSSKMFPTIFLNYRLAHSWQAIWHHNWQHWQFVWIGIQIYLE
jgi:hypothetical protein